MNTVAFGCFSFTISCQSSTKFDMARKKKTNLYKVLSLESETAGFDEIKKAYRSIALRYHPDVCPPAKKEDCTKMFVELNAAYETLSNPVLRRMYDRELSSGESEGFAVRSEFSREVWEDQLCRLMERSERRKGDKRGFSKKKL